MHLKNVQACRGGRGFWLADGEGARPTQTPHDNPAAPAPRIPRLPFTRPVPALRGAGRRRVKGSTPSERAATPNPAAPPSPPPATRRAAHRPLPLPRARIACDQLTQTKFFFFRNDQVRLARPRAIDFSKQQKSNVSCTELDPTIAGRVAMCSTDRKEPAGERSLAKGVQRGSSVPSETETTLTAPL